jgi:hypothetical protein
MINACICEGSAERLLICELRNTIFQFNFTCSVELLGESRSLGYRYQGRAAHLVPISHAHAPLMISLGGKITLEPVAHDRSWSYGLASRLAKGHIHVRYHHHSMRRPWCKRAMVQTASRCLDILRSPIPSRRDRRRPLHLNQTNLSHEA